MTTAPLRIYVRIGLMRATLDIPRTPKCILCSEYGKMTAAFETIFKNSNML